MKYRKLLIWGTLIIALSGAAMHFVFDLLGQWPPIGVIVPVNESVWEHLKMTFYPMLLFWLIAAPRMVVPYKKLSVPLALGIVVSLVLIPAIFYLAKNGLGIETLALDISIAVFAAFIGQWIIGHLLKNDYEPSTIGALVATLLIASIALAFALWTFNPPKLPIFLDPPTGGYGIYKQV